MNTTSQSVDQLVEVMTFDGDREDDTTIVRGNINRLCVSDETFASEALRVMHETSPMARYALRNWLDSYSKMGTAKRVSASISTSVFSYSASQYILDNAVISGEMYTYYVERGGNHSVPETQAAHQLMVKVNPLMPKLSKLSRIEASRYSASLAAAGSVLGVELKDGIAVHEPLFKEKAKPFVEWASGHEDFDLVIATALRVRSLEPKDIEALNEILKSTHGSLNDGVL